MHRMLGVGRFKVNGTEGSILRDKFGYAPEFQRPNQTLLKILAIVSVF
jgi:hypothetical protein